MKPKDRVISFPWMGKVYSRLMKKSLENLGLNVQPPPSVTSKTINLGVKSSSEMMCLKGDTEITSDNYTVTKIKEIKIGNKVLTHKGRFKKVIDTLSRDYDGTILKINCGGLFKFEITPEHPVLILKKDKVKQKVFIPEFMDINKAKKKDFLAIPIPREIQDIDHFDWKKEYNPNYFKFKNDKFPYTPELLRVLGYWLAEGSIIYNRRKSKTTSGLSFVFSSKEKKFIKEICEIVKRNFNCSISTRNPKPTTTEILIYSKSLADIFLELCGEKSDKKKLHKDIMKLDPKLQLEILRGYLRGDGSFSLSKVDRRYMSATVSKELANQLFWLLVRNYVKPEFASRQQKNRKKSYILRMWKGNIPLFEKVSIKQIRKTCPHHLKTENYIFIPIKKIDKEHFKGKVYNLEVEDDNSYVANYLTVHNCFPYKVTLGNFIESLENGANTLLMWDSQGTCRLRHYYKIQEFTLNHLGYNEFEMYGISGKNIFRTIRRISGRSSIDVIREIYFTFPRKLKEYDSGRNRWSDKKPNIGIIGEIFSAIDEVINYGIEKKIRSYGANPFNTVTLSDFIGNNLFGKKFIPFLRDDRKKYKIEANKYLNGKLGGHGYENICNLLELVDRGVDGVIHLLPLTCMPETTVEPFLNQICKDNRVPLLRIPIDENNSEANLETRLETFVDLIKMRK